MASRLIVTADDFGLSVRVNHAVVRAFGEGLISHASVLVNLPAFDDACRLVQAHQLQSRIGLHLNLTEGAPLTAGILQTPFCANGQFVSLNRWRYYRVVRAAARRAVADEVTAQIARARTAGLNLSHLDSHNDIHTSPCVASIVLDVAARHGITRVRAARNCGSNQGTVRWLHHSRYNEWLSREGLNPLDYFGTIDDLLWLARHDAARRPFSAEAMTHPRLTDGDDRLVDAPSMEPLALRVQQLHREAFGAIGELSLRPAFD